MKVEWHPLDGPMAKLVAAEADHEAGIHEGEVIAYRCGECGNSDETLMQVVHDADCPLAGEHGRAHYGDLERGIGTDTAELQPNHQIIIIRMGETDSRLDVYHGEPIGFRCEECGNSDETLSEIVHDETCSLAGRHGRELLKRRTAN